MSSPAPQINILIPLYNESAGFEPLVMRLNALIESSPLSIELILIDDGSTDDTASKMRALSWMNAKFHSLFLSKNFGHQAAIAAGLDYVNASDAVFIIDGDLQDPPELLDAFYGKLKEGFDVVYGIRKDRKEPALKVFFYKLFYRTLRSVSSTSIYLDSGDFSLISRRVAELIKQMPEKDKFIRGMRSWVGFKQVGFPYERNERKHGSSKYSIRNLLKLALNGLYNFSDFPIKVISNFALLIISSSLFYFLYVVLKKFLWGNVPDGFTALLFMIILFGGIQLLAIGILGQYIIRVFFQVKNRPTYLIKEKIIKGESLKD